MAGMDGIYLHDPTAFMAIVHPELFTFKQGPVRVVREGFAAGCTIMDSSEKDDRYKERNAWTGRPKVRVAVDVDADKMTSTIFEALKKSGSLLLHRPVEEPRAKKKAGDGCAIM